MSVYSYGPQGPDGQGYHSQGNRRAAEPFAAPGGSGPVIDMVPEGRESATRFCTGLCWWLCAAQRPISALYTPTAVPCPNRRTSWCIRRRPETRP